LIIVLVQGPYLVRSAAIEGKTIFLKGDINTKTVVEVFAPGYVASLAWNGKKVSTSKTSYGSLKTTITAFNGKVALPSLDSWKFKDSLPERLPDYNDSGIA
jgi:hypothetical protein